MKKEKGAKQEDNIKNNKAKKIKLAILATLIIAILIFIRFDIENSTIKFRDINLSLPTQDETTLPNENISDSFGQVYNNVTVQDETVANEASDIAEQPQNNSNVFNQDYTDYIVDIYSKMDELEQKVSYLETRLASFNNLAVRIPNQKAIFVNVIDLQEKIILGEPYHNELLKISSLTDDKFIIDRIELLGDPTLMANLKGLNSIINMFDKANNNLYKSKQDINISNQKNVSNFLSKFITVKKVNNNIDEEELKNIETAYTLLNKREISKALKQIKQLSPESYQYFQSFVSAANFYVEAQMIAKDLKTYVNF